MSSERKAYHLPRMAVIPRFNRVSTEAHTSSFAPKTHHVNKFAKKHNAQDQNEVEETKLIMRDTHGVTFLNSNELRWVNKRLKKDNIGIHSQVQDTTVNTLYDSFAFLDTDSSGDIQKKEFQLAMNQLTKNRALNAQDAAKVTAFFKSMDADGNGAVNFDEFLNGLASNVRTQKENEALRNVCIDFATLFRRLKLQESLKSNEYNNSNDTEKFKKLKELINFNYFSSEEIQENKHLKAQHRLAHDKYDTMHKSSKLGAVKEESAGGIWRDTFLALNDDKQIDSLRGSDKDTSNNPTNMNIKTIIESNSTVVLRKQNAKPRLPGKLPPLANINTASSMAPSTSEEENVWKPSPQSQNKELYYQHYTRFAK